MRLAWRETFSGREQATQQPTEKPEPVASVLDLDGKARREREEGGRRRSSNRCGDADATTVSHQNSARCMQLRPKNDEPERETEAHRRARHEWPWGEPSRRSVEGFARQEPSRSLTGVLPAESCVNRIEAGRREKAYSRGPMRRQEATVRQIPTVARPVCVDLCVEDPRKLNPELLPVKEPREYLPSGRSLCLLIAQSRSRRA
jgi:hypothetical protein